VGDSVRLSNGLMQPVAVDEVAAEPLALLLQS
jgi:hypothetical protein